jgi:hypothetical protein
MCGGVRCASENVHQVRLGMIPRGNDEYPRQSREEDSRERIIANSASLPAAFSAAKSPAICR